MRGLAQKRGWREIAEAVSGQVGLLRAADGARPRRAHLLGRRGERHRTVGILHANSASSAQCLPDFVCKSANIAQRTIGSLRSAPKLA